MMFIFLLGGLLLLLAGGEALVRGAASIARKLNIPELVIGVTLVGFGTSAPELVTSLQAIQTGSVGIAVGNVVGSNIANVFLVLALSALVSPIVVNPRALARDGTIMIAATLLLCGLLWFNQFGRAAGIVLVSLLAVYLSYTLLTGRETQAPATELHRAEGEAITGQYGLVAGLLLVIGGLAGVIFGAGLFVEGAVALARTFAISETLIGLTIVAVGTSLPELSTSLIATARKRSDVALGNIIGSCIFNILGILGLTAILQPFSVRGDVTAEALAAGTPVSILSTVDVGALVLSAGLLMLFAMTGRTIARWEGAVLLLGYILYMGLTFGFIPQLEIIPNG